LNRGARWSGECLGLCNRLLDHGAQLLGRALHGGPGVGEDSEPLGDHVHCNIAREAPLSECLSGSPDRRRLIGMRNRPAHLVDERACSRPSGRSATARRRYLAVDPDNRLAADSLAAAGTG
jgi:hypothetical protein